MTLSRSWLHSENSGGLRLTAPHRPCSFLNIWQSALDPAGPRRSVMKPIEAPKTAPIRASAAPPPQRDTPFGIITPRQPLWPGEWNHEDTHAQAPEVETAPEVTR